MEEVCESSDLRAAMITAQISEDTTAISPDAGVDSPPSPELMEPVAPPSIPGITGVDDALSPVWFAVELSTELFTLKLPFSVGGMPCG